MDGWTGLPDDRSRYYSIGAQGAVVSYRLVYASMSLFDVIKYPISAPASVEEMIALPPEVFNKWRNWLQNNWAKDGYTIEMGTAELRRMLLEKE